MDTHTVNEVTARSITSSLDRIESFSRTDADMIRLREAVDLRRWEDVAARAERLAGRYERLLTLTTDDATATLAECATAYLRNVVRYAEAATDGRLAD